MKLVLEVDFWFDGIDESNRNDIKNYLEALLNNGAEATNSEINLAKITPKNIEVENLIQKTIKDLRNNGNQLSETYADGMTYASELLGMTID